MRVAASLSERPNSDTQAFFGPSGFLCFFSSLRCVFSLKLDAQPDGPPRSAANERPADRPTGRAAGQAVDERFSQSLVATWHLLVGDGEARSNDTEPLSVHTNTNARWLTVTRFVGHRSFQGVESCCRCLVDRRVDS